MNTTRIEDGLTNTTKKSPFGNYIAACPTNVHSYFNNFDTYTAADWLVDRVGTGTTALVNGNGGLVTITNSALNGDYVVNNKNKDSFLVAAGKPIWFSSRLKISDTILSLLIIGLKVGSETVGALVSGIFFIKELGTPNLSFKLMDSLGINENTNVCTMVSNQFTELSFFYNGSDRVEVFCNGDYVTFLNLDNMPFGTTLTPAFGIYSAESAIKTLTVDYIFSSKAR